MMAGVASKDYVGTAFAKGSQLPSNTALQSLVPLCHLLYSQSMTLIHHYPGRSLETVVFETGVSQGWPTGSPAAILPIHFGLHLALSRHPNKLVRAFGIIDDNSLLGAARDMGPLFQDVRKVLKATCVVDLKLKKCSLLILQMHTVVDPAPSLIIFYEQIPQLHCLLLVTQGIVVVSTNQFIHRVIHKIAFCRSRQTHSFSWWDFCFA